MQRHVLAFYCNVKKSKYRERPLTLLDLNYPSKQIKLWTKSYGGVTI